ncbi:MAG: DUF512 domain-containing protein [candidate division KSB1 bacterium]|nr:DUF512 domain-containing protein [candidate division KSB1 bacterium]
MLVVRNVARRGTARRLGLVEGDRILQVNGSPVRDEIDFQFYGSEEEVRLRVLRGREVLELSGRRRFGEPWGIAFEEIKYRSCGNHCIFCFVDQNPPGLRPSLYFKDEDYRLSFLHGNYVTLTNVGRRDLQRIIEQRLSPLYVSVHATDPFVRTKLLGIRRDDGLLAKLQELVEGGIEIHAQIVLVPDYNDGEVLLRTLEDLRQMAPGLASVAVVPVGLTRYRQGLPELRPVDSSLAAQVVEALEPIARELRRTLGRHWIYLADELYLLAGLPIPPSERYDDFPQVENGVGMLRSFLDVLAMEAPQFPKRLPRARTLGILTGELMAPILRERVLPALSAIEGLEVEIRAVRNRFFGDSVSVSGLLVGADLAAEGQLFRRTPDLVLIPGNALNPDGLFLDDWTVPRLEKAIGSEVIPVGQSLREVLRVLSGRGTRVGSQRARWVKRSVRP